MVIFNVSTAFKLLKIKADKVIVFNLTLHPPGELDIFAGWKAPKIDIEEHSEELRLLLYYDGKEILIESVVIRFVLFVVKLKT